MKLISEKRFQLYYILVALILAAVLGVFYYNNLKVKSSSYSAEHAQEVLRKNDNVLLDILDIETGVRGYIISENDIYLETFNNAVKAMNTNLSTLSELTRNNPEQNSQVDSLKIMTSKKLILLQKIIDDRKSNLLDEYEKIAILKDGKVITDEIKSIISQINVDEYNALKLRKTENENSIQNSEILFFLLLILIFVIFTLVFIIVKSLKVRNDELELFTASQKLLSNYSLSLIEASLDPLITINIDGKITDMNEATVKITGVEREELIGSDFFEYFTEPQMAREVYQKVFAEGSVADSPLTICHNEGKLTDVLFNGSVYKDNKGLVLGIVIVARDVTAQKLLSNYSLSLIEASRDPLVTISIEGKITDMNEATVTITGLDRDHLTGSDFFDYFTEPQMAREVYQEVFAKGSVADSPLTLRHKKGKLTDVLFNGSVYKDDQGNVLGAVVVARDITDQKRIETELIEAKVFAELATGIAEEEKRNAENATLIAENAVKAKQQFLSNMSHEIRTPMNAIIGFTKVVLKTDLTAKQKEYLDAIKMSGDALIVLINDILDLAKVDAGKMSFEKTPFKLMSSISSMIHLFETKIQEKNLKLTKEYDSNIPEVVVGDPIRLHQVILNLISNAVKFTTKGKITVSVRLIEEDLENVTIEFAVTDTGIGIPEEKIATIFDNFQQASSGTSRIYGGTGLGLAIVKQLVEPQGGTIKVISTVGEGTTFSFRLVFQKTTADAELETEILEVDKLRKNIKVLVVEDIPLNQLLMKTLLDDFGFERDIAENGKIAIEKMQNNSYDVILMDLQMPEMNGFEATEYIRKTMNSKIPIIALTADVTTVDLAKCKSVGMNDYIAKPVDERLLYSKIVGIVRKPLAKKAKEMKKNIIVQKPKCTDLGYLESRTKSNPKLMMEMIAAYLQQTPTVVTAMEDGMRNKDWELLRASAHKMIPSFSIMGMSSEFEDMAKKIHSYTGDLESRKEEVADLVLQLSTICNQSCEELKIEFNNLKNKN
jgi:PAS domain S-box-containing protein